ncbi:MAG TPA: MBL fold metallo-hydrolase [Nitrospira sp.]|nr:MBL fold metallo-hydrolase [Nitrospira sp.]
MTTDTRLILPANERVAVTDRGSVQFIGNATVLIRYGGITILTDPTFIHRHEQVSIGYGMQSTRLVDPAMDIRDLPPLDLIVLSHFHGDHFDQVAERELAKSIPIITNGEAAKELLRRGFRYAQPIETWSFVSVEKGDLRLRVTSMPGRHGPPLSDWIMPEVMGSMLEFEPAGGAPFCIYITGDTLAFDGLDEIPRRYREIDLALLHLGGTRVFGILVTMDAKQGVEVMNLIRPARAIPIHFNDYDVFTSPLADFEKGVQAAGFQDRVHYLAHGGTYAFQAGATRAAA